MGSCGSGDTDSITTSIDTNEVANFNLDDTVPFDSQLSPSSVSGENKDIGMDNDWRYFDNTVPFDDDAPVDDDALETQPVNLAGETQALSIAGETEALSIAGETQVLDDIDDEEDNNTQLLDEVDEEVSIDSHSDRTDGTGILENVNEPSSDHPQCIVEAQLADYKQISCEPLSREKKLLEKIDPVINQQISSGCMPPRFTSVCIESLREAAHNMNLKQNKDGTNPIMGTSQAQEPLSLKNNEEPRFTSIRIESLREAARKMDLKQNKDGTNPVTGASQAQELLSVKNNEEPFLGCTEKTREYDHGEHGGKANGDFHKDKSRIASSVVRKLFNDDLPAEKEGCSYNSNDVDGEESLTKLSIYDDELAGLSYVNSQEPGELTQAAALDVVDKLLKDNDVLEFDQEDNLVNSVQESKKSLPGLKGQQSLAKRVNGSGNAGKTGVYDWDDSREDDGGGDIFLRRKDEFLEGAMPRRKSLPAVQKIKASRPDDSYNKRMREVQSDSRILLHNQKVRDDTVKDAAKESKRNLISDLDELFNINYSGPQLEPTNAADAQGMLDVGLNTQMAAEAMEALGNCEGSDDHVANEAARSSLADQPNNSSPGTRRAITSKKCSESNVRTRRRVKSDLQNSSLLKAHNEESREQCKTNNLMKRSKRSMINVEDNVISDASEIISKGQRRSAGTSKRHKGNQLLDSNGSKGENGGSLVNKRNLQSLIFNFSPVARRTRRSLISNKLKPDRPSGSHTEEDGRVDSPEEKNSAGSSLADQPNNSSPGTRREITSKKCSETNVRTRRRVKSDLQNSSLLKAHNEESREQCKTNNLMKRSKRSMINVEDNVISDASEIISKGQRRSAGTSKRHKGNQLLDSNGSKGENGGSLVNKRNLQNLIFNFSPVARRTRQSLISNKLKPDRPSGSHTEEDGRVDSPEEKNSAGFQTSKTLDPKSKRDALDRPRRSLRKLSSHEGSGRLVGSSNLTVQSEDVWRSAAKTRKMRTDDSPRGSCKSSDLTSATPDKCRTPVNEASPVCMGDNYYKQSCNGELRRELCSLSATRLEFTPSKDSRKRRDMTDVRILYSQHLNEDVIKHQKKILARLGVSVVTSILDATHFIADQFVRTRNMLEAIASGKPVVTHLWIESCGQTNCLIDEKNYILRDAKKEKEFGFSMPVSLARATRHPLLVGRRVLITPNTKPSKETISHLVKAVQGQAIERIGRSLVKDDKTQDDLLILSCEDDYALCVPFLEKGTAVYSSELLLNGIVTQKLEYERHRLFADNVKKTRSTIWLKDGGTYRAVNKCK
ncbi:hypothetical protein K1719_000401 [Acacia pycnantha]|nr:hypothetical protein K1719_000401 [Acacia pycnantha]